MQHPVAGMTSDVAPKFYTVLSSFELLPVFRSPRAGVSGVGGSGRNGRDEPFMSDIGGLLPIALWGRTVL